jgi:hypothetical protein
VTDIHTKKHDRGAAGALGRWLFWLAGLPGKPASRWRSVAAWAWLFSAIPLFRWSSALFAGPDAVDPSAWLAAFALVTVPATALLGAILAWRKSPVSGTEVCIYGLGSLCLASMTETPAIAHSRTLSSALGAIILVSAALFFASVLWARLKSCGMIELILCWLGFLAPQYMLLKMLVFSVNWHWLGLDAGGVFTAGVLGVYISFFVLLVYWDRRAFQ